MSKWVFLNGDFVMNADAKLHYSDLSFQRGFGIFDFFRLNGNRPLFLNDHLNRFYQSAEAMHLALTITKAELQSVVFALLNKNNRPDSGVRLALTGGFSEDGFTPGTPNLLVSQQNVLPPTDAQRRQGVRLLSYPHQRQLPGIKSIDYLMAVWLLPLKRQKGVDDFLYHAEGRVTECPRSNFFLVTKNDCVVTPADNVLNGITRKHVLALARQQYQVEERAIGLDEIRTAKEAFLTSTTKQVLRVAQIDDTVFSGSAVSQNLQRLFHSAYLD